MDIDSNQAMYREINKSECIGRKIKTFVGPMESKNS